MALRLRVLAKLLQRDSKSVMKRWVLWLQAKRFGERRERFSRAIGRQEAGAQAEEDVR